MLDEIPATLLEAVRYFSDVENCNHFMAEIKWPDGKIVCPKCGNESCHELASRIKLAARHAPAPLAEDIKAAL
jgi:hypothetical protein